MCEKHSYTYTTREGVREKQSRTNRCDKARRSGIVCENISKFKHPEGERPQSSSLLSPSSFPPSPPSSDTSYVYSGSDGERSHKRRSGVYINGEKVAEMTHKTSLSHQTSRRERRGSNHVVIVEPPKSPRTPPRHETPSGSPARSPTYIHGSSYSSYYTRPEVNLEINRAPIHYDYITTTPRTRRDSYSQGSGSISDEEARLRRLRREVKKAEEAKRQAEEATREAEKRAKEARKEESRKEISRQHKLDKEIRRQNENIASRPAAAPTPPSPLKYRRGSVSIRQTDDMLADAMRNTYLDAEKERRRREKRAQEELEKRERDEETARMERLRARMNTSSSGHGSSRRPQVVYNDPYR